jgi:UDP-glucose 4-epimerase
VVETARRVTGRPIRQKWLRAVPAIRPDWSLARQRRDVLGWDPQFPELEKIIESAWAWHQAHSGGYDE